MTQADREQTQVVVAELRKRAALLGGFDPLRLLPETLSQAQKAEALILFGADCDEVIDGGKVLWTLKADRRWNTIAQIPTKEAAGAIAKDIEGLREDALGREIQAALLDQPLPTPARDAASNIDSKYVARNFAAAAPFIDAEPAANSKSVREEITQRAVADRSRVASPMGGWNRDEEWGVIERFIADAAPPQAATAGLLLTGAAAEGRSDVIAAMEARAARCADFPPVIIIDSHRPSLAMGNRMEILREIMRQLEQCRPAWTARLKPVWDICDRPKLFGAVDDVPGLLRWQSLALATLNQALRPQGQGDPALGRIVLIFEHFEDIIQREAAAATNLLDWAHDLATGGGMSDLRLIVSAAAHPKLQQPSLRSWFAGSLDLSRVTSAAGIALLRASEAGATLFDDRRALDAVRAFHGDPLALQALRNYAAHHGERDTDLLIQAGLERAGISGECPQALLYDRILAHISDPALAKLARPALVLRLMTAGVIRQVLAEPCGLGAIDDAAAQDLLARLAGTVWIVESRSKPDVAIHQTHLRRRMLECFAPDAPEAAVIHLAAAKWHERGIDTALTASEQAVEAFYHRSCADPESQPAIQQALSFGPALGEDLADLPPRARGTAKVAMGQLLCVGADETDALPLSLRLQVKTAKEQWALIHGRTEDVARPGERGFKRRPIKLAPTTFTEVERLYGHAIKALWTEGKIRHIAELGDWAFARLWREGSKEGFLETAGDPVFSAVWHYLVATSALGDWPRSLTDRASWEALCKLYPHPANPPGGKIAPQHIHGLALVLAFRTNADAVPTQATGLQELLRNMRFGRIDSLFALRALHLKRAMERASEREPSHAPDVPVRFARLLAGPIGGLSFDEDDPSSSDAVHIALAKIQVSGRTLPFDALDGHADRSRPGMAKTRLLELHAPLLGRLRGLTGARGDYTRLLRSVFPGAGLRAAIARSYRSCPVPRMAERFLPSMIDIADQSAALIRLGDAIQAMAPDPATQELVGLVRHVEEIFAPNEDRAPARRRG